MPPGDPRPPEPSKSPPEPRPDSADTEEREGATEREVGDRIGPGAGFDNEPEQERDSGGVS